MNPDDLLTDLRAHQTLCRELLAVIEQERQALRAETAADLARVYDSKRALAPRLQTSLETIRRHRVAWQQLDPAERARHPEIAALIRQVQDLILRLIVLDRENVQGLLRRGLVPAREMGQVTAQRPHFVAGLYRQAAGAPPAA